MLCNLITNNEIETDNLVQDFFTPLEVILEKDNPFEKVEENFLVKINEIKEIGIDVSTISTKSDMFKNDFRLCFDFERVDEEVSKLLEKQMKLLKKSNRTNI